MSATRRSPTRQPETPSSPVTLRSLTGQVGVELLRVVAAPAGLDVPVRGIVLHDIADDRNVARGNVVLGIGIDSCNHAAVALMRAAAAAGAAAVVLKEHGELPADLLDAVRNGGPALMAISATPHGVRSTRC